MTTPAADYDASVRALRTQTLPAIVEYTQEGSAYGIAHWSGAPERIVVDVRAKKVISVTPPGSNDPADISPVTTHVFDPACYVPAAEKRTRWNGVDAVAIAVSFKAGCSNHDSDVTTIYANASTFELLGADGSETDDGMSVDYVVHYARFGAYILPSSISAHAHGHGWLFWARERAEIRYTNYTFSDVRRQSPSLKDTFEARIRP